jgi:hypothetical protein
VSGTALVVRLVHKFRAGATGGLSTRAFTLLGKPAVAPQVQQWHPKFNGRERYGLEEALEAGITNCISVSHYQVAGAISAHSDA